MTLTLSYLREALIDGGAGPHGIAPPLLIAVICALLAGGIMVAATPLSQSPRSPRKGPRKVYGKFLIGHSHHF